MVVVLEKMFISIHPEWLKMLYISYPLSDFFDNLFSLFATEDCSIITDWKFNKNHSFDPIVFAHVRTY